MLISYEDGIDSRKCQAMLKKKWFSVTQFSILLFMKSVGRWGNVMPLTITQSVLS